MLEQVLDRSVSLAAFEQWLYKAADLERELGAADYGALLAFDFKARHAWNELERLLGDIYERHRPGCLVRDRAIRLASGLMDGSIDFHVAVRGLAHLEDDSISSLFDAIDDELDDIPAPAQYPLWDEKALAEKLAAARPRIEKMREEAIEAARTILKSCA